MHELKCIDKAHTDAQLQPMLGLCSFYICDPVNAVGKLDHSTLVSLKYTGIKLRYIDQLLTTAKSSFFGARVQTSSSQSVKRYKPSFSLHTTYLHGHYIME